MRLLTTRAQRNDFAVDFKVATMYFNVSKHESMPKATND